MKRKRKQGKTADAYICGIKWKAIEGLEIIDTVGNERTQKHLQESDYEYLVSLNKERGALATFTTAYWAGVREGYHLRKEVEEDAVLRDWI